MTNPSRAGRVQPTDTEPKDSTAARLETGTDAAGVRPGSRDARALTSVRSKPLPAERHE